ncbi:hypothetical protein GCM10010420_35930 [Streptomyces glaucosporus]|uniref:Secreted protein n=1 Tax=Streptomyces glaucosporus TaxID=284044 RepID=A0ABN3IJA0_9ACTN
MKAGRRVASGRTPPRANLPVLAGAGPVAVTAVTSASEVAGSSSPPSSQTVGPLRNPPTGAGSCATWPAAHSAAARA